jgi:hypothetical protein
VSTRTRGQADKLHLPVAALAATLRRAAQLTPGFHFSAQATGHSLRLPPDRSDPPLCRSPALTARQLPLDGRLHLPCSLASLAPRLRPAAMAHAMFAAR